MSRIANLEIILFSLLITAVLHYAEAGAVTRRLEEEKLNGLVPTGAVTRRLEEEKLNRLTLTAAAPCPPSQFQCKNGKCIAPNWFCDKANDCGDNSDEEYCNVDPTFQCPVGWVSCPNNRRCILSHWMCDGRIHCPDVSEEKFCSAKKELKSWFLRRRKAGSRADRWGSQVHRIAVALYLANDATFSPGNTTGDEIRYELTIQLLQRLAEDKKMSSQELALYIHGLLVSCMNPRDFYGNDLVQELRRRVESYGNFTNPFLMLVLCNAEDVMTLKDVERVTAAYDSHQRPFWTDSQAMASMALSCISSRTDNFVDERILKNMLQEMKKHQFRNGTIDNIRTTALVTQALFTHESYKKDFDLNSALKVLIDGLKGTKSLLNAYYTLPVLYRKSLLNVSSSHCSKDPVDEDEALEKILDRNGETIIVQYSIWMGDEIDLGRTWRLRMRVNSTIYNAIETVAKIDNRQKVEYNVVNGKPYVTALNGKEDDTELGTFWFIYLKNLTSDEGPKVVEESPVDVQLQPNQETILWYMRGPWNAHSPMKKSFTSS